MGAEGQCAWKLLIKPRNVAGQTLTEKSGHLMHFDGSMGDVTCCLLHQYMWPCLMDVSYSIVTIASDSCISDECYASTRRKLAD